MPRIMDVTAVHVSILKSNPPKVAIHAIGHVPTTGWTQIELDPYLYLVPPADGVWDFDFVGKAPSGIVGQVVLQVYASIVVPMPRWLRGVRVHAKTNTIDAQLGKEIPLAEV
jgi:hypothetical protein